MNYSDRIKRARVYSPLTTTPLDVYCRAGGIPYFVQGGRPTLIEFDPAAEYVFVNFPGQSVTVPASEDAPPMEVLELLGYVAMRYDARETLAHIHRNPGTGGGTRSGLGDHFKGLVWSNPNAPDSAYIRAALLKPRFLQLLEMAKIVGLERIQQEWAVLVAEDSSEAQGASKSVERILRNMSEGARRA